MFFQHNRVGLTHSPQVSWGHATSRDLVNWHEVEPALVPQPPEVGCWSGSTVLTADGPVIAYTRIASADWDRGQVALARPTEGMSHWQRDSGPPVVDGPPAQPRIVAFRDPQIRRGRFASNDSDGWTAVIGGGLVGVGGCAVQYSISPDLSTWVVDGVVASRDWQDHEPFATGTVWECPQFLNVDDQWVLLVSVWQDGEGLYEAYAVGDYDGRAFRARRWGRFAHDDLQYATTTFTDSRGTACAMSWLRERPDLPADDPSPWRSAMSLPMQLSVRDDRLIVSHHPAVAAQFSRELFSGPLQQDVALQVPQQGIWRLSWELAGESQATATSADTATVWKLSVSASGHCVLADGTGAPLVAWQMVWPGHAVLDMVIDADIISITSPQAGGCVAARLPPGHRTPSTVRFHGDTVHAVLAALA